MDNQVKEGNNIPTLDKQDIPTRKNYSTQINKHSNKKMCWLQVTAWGHHPYELGQAVLLSKKYFVNMKSVNIHKNDLPPDFTPHIELMKESDKNWHYDPAATDKSALRRNTIQINDHTKKFLDTYSRELPIEIGTSVYEGEQKAFKSNNLVWRKLDHVYHGYHENNTKAQYLRKTYDESPTEIKEIIDQTGLVHASAGVIRLKPGNVIPWHYDSHIFFNENDGKGNNKLKPERHIIFPMQWDWGHIYQIGNNVLSNWKAGSRFTWPSLRYHLAANVGISDFVMIAVTGVQSDA